MRLGAVLFALAAAAIVAAWGWFGAAVEMPVSPLGAGEKIQCVSYAPFRGDQDPFGPDVPIDPRQIEEDLVRLKPLTDCIRTYSVDHGLDQIPEIAGRHGMKVMLGLWLSSLPDLSRHQTETAIALARRFPEVIQSIVVGNEVLLRGEMSAPDLVKTIRAVKAQVTMPVTYADVWEFWLRYRDVAAARRADARGGAAVARQPGTRGPGGAGAGETCGLPGQRDRSLRSALETTA